MPGGLTVIPSRTDGSLGRTKYNAKVISDLNVQYDAAEFNVGADALLAVCTEVGLTNGTTPGSLVARVTALEALPAGTRPVVALVVGNALAGDTAGDCDFLDPGDCTGITAAFAAMAGKRGTIFLRRGIYTMAANASPFSVSNVAWRVQGEGKTCTKIIAPAGNAGTVPWRVFTSVVGDISDLEISIPQRAASVLAPTDVFGAIELGPDSACHIHDIRITLQDQFDALATPFAGISVPFDVRAGWKITDVEVNTDTGTVWNGDAGNSYAFIGIALGFVFAGVDPPPALPFGSPEPIIERVRISGRTDNAATPPYMSIGVGAMGVTEFTLRNTAFSNVQWGLMMPLTNSTTLTPLYMRGPVVDDIEIHVADGAADTFGGAGIAVFLSDANSVLRLERFVLRNFRVFGPEATGAAPASVQILAPVQSTRGFRIESGTITALYNGSFSYFVVQGALAGSVEIDGVELAERDGVTPTQPSQADIQDGVNISASRIEASTINVSGSVTDAMLSLSRCTTLTLADPSKVTLVGNRVG